MFVLSELTEKTSSQHAILRRTLFGQKYYFLLRIVNKNDNIIKTEVTHFVTQNLKKHAYGYASTYIIDTFSKTLWAEKKSVSVVTYDLLKDITISEVNDKEIFDEMIAFIATL